MPLSIVNRDIAHPISNSGLGQTTKIVSPIIQTSLQLYNIHPLHSRLVNSNHPNLN